MPLPISTLMMNLYKIWIPFRFPMKNPFVVSLSLTYLFLSLHFSRSLSLFNSLSPSLYPSVPLHPVSLFPSFLSLSLFSLSFSLSLSFPLLSISSLSLSLSKTSLSLSLFRQYCYCFTSLIAFDISWNWVTHLGCTAIFILYLLSNNRIEMITYDCFSILSYSLHIKIHNVNNLLFYQWYPAQCGKEEHWWNSWGSQWRQKRREESTIDYVYRYINQGCQVTPKRCSRWL